MAAYFIKAQFNALAVKVNAEVGPRERMAAEPFDGMLPARNLEHCILEKLKGRPGGLSLIELRASLQTEPRPSLATQRKLKAEFDEAVLSLYKDRRVYLDRHDHPMRLSDAERQYLVSDGAGNYYVGITLRGDFD